MAWRVALLANLELLRQDKKIGKALEAKVEIVVNETGKQLLDEKALRELVNVSSLKIESDEPGKSDEAVLFSYVNQAASFKISKADGQKCERCWHWETDIGQNAEHPTICGRCVEAVKQFKT